MQHPINKLALLLGLGAALTLPGLAAADTPTKYSMKLAVQQQVHDQHRHAAPLHVRDDRHGRYDRHDRYDRRDRHDRHKHKGHRYHGKHHGHHAPNYNARWGHVGRYGHYHGRQYCDINHVHGYRRINGYYMAPHLGVHIDLR